MSRSSYVIWWRLVIYHHRELCKIGLSLDINQFSSIVCHGDNKYTMKVLLNNKYLTDNISIIASGLQLKYLDFLTMQHWHFVESHASMKSNTLACISVILINKYNTRRWRHKTDRRLLAAAAPVCLFRFIHMGLRLPLVES